MEVKYGPNDSKSEWVDLPHGEVIPKALFDEVQEKWSKHDAKRSAFNRLGTRIYLLTGLLQYEDGSSFRGLSGVSGSEQRRYYYWNQNHRLSVDAIKLEKGVFATFRKTFENDRELAAHLSQLVNGKTSKLDLVTQQLHRSQKDLAALKGEENRLLESITLADSGATPIVLQLLESQLKEKEQRKTDLESLVLELEKERDRLAAITYDPKKVRNGLSTLFSQMVKAPPIKQKAFLRSIFQRVQVSRDHQVKLVWRSGPEGD
jgi:hypothetical protein